MVYRRSLVQCVAAVVMALDLFAGDTHSAERVPDRPVVRVAYFIPSDREPEPEYRTRLDRVMTEIQRFYRAGMDENGFGEVTFEPDRDAAGTLRIYEVRGQGPMRDYGRNSADKVRAEVRDALLKQHLDIDSETIVIFQLLLEWRGDKAVEIGPYVGGGGPRGGTAWVYDDARLDPRLLSSREPGGYYNGPCSLGRFNTHQIGGIAHELGHAFGLPHDCERDSERPKRGRSLMGYGNHTYGEEHRGEGRGAFLSAASALPLSVHPLFTGRRVSATPSHCRFVELKALEEVGKLIITGRLGGGTLAIGLLARNDPTEPSGDYDAVGWIGQVSDQGEFRLEIGELKPGEQDLRITAYTQSGDARNFTVRFWINEDKRPDLQPFLRAERELESLRPPFLTPERRKHNLLGGGTFEDETVSDWKVRAYRPEQDAARRNSDDAREGKASLLIRSEQANGNDIAFVQKVKVNAGTRYLLSGWARTRGVAVIERGGVTGANLSLFGRSEMSESLFGDRDWTYLALVFDTGDQTEIEVGPGWGTTAVSPMARPGSTISS